MKKLALILLIFLLLGCNDSSTIVESELEFKEVQFDLQWGFANNSITLMVDSSFHFYAMLDQSSPLAGPEASIKIMLEQGTHELLFHRMSLESVYDTFSDTTIIEIGNSDKYYVGLSIYNDSLNVVVQDSSFFYY